MNKRFGSGDKENVENRAGIKYFFLGSLCYCSIHMQRSSNRCIDMVEAKMYLLVYLCNQ
jgi:hypothetical protein